MASTHCYAKGKCEICNKHLPVSDLFPLKMIRTSVLNTALSQKGVLDIEGYVCGKDLRQMRIDHIEKILYDDKGAFSRLEEDVLNSLKDQEVLSENINAKFDRELTLGERLADKVARFGGSWSFILSFVVILIAWMGVNTLLLGRGFDPYPYILLNLVLSCLAALQAPVIMMSQNREAEKERLRANEDYCTNLKAELEIQQIHSKLDLFMKQQWESLLELQKIQIELSEELLHRGRKKGSEKRR